MHRNLVSVLLISTFSIFGCSSSNDTSMPTGAEQMSGNDTNEANNPNGANNANNTNDTPVALDTIRENLLLELAGYQNEALAEKLYELVANIEVASTAVQSQGSIISNDVVAFDEPSTRSSFNCPFGGTMVTEQISTEVDMGGGASQSNDYDQYMFDQCVAAINGGALADGNYELNGIYTYESHSRASTNGVFKTLVATWNTFKLQPTNANSNGITYELDGNVSLSSSSNPSATTATRDSQINRYAESNGTSTSLEITSADFYQYRQPIPFPGRVEGPRTVRFNGTYNGPLSQDATLQIRTDPEFTEWKSDNADANEPLIGSLQISSSDGGVLTMTANGALAISFLRADGTTTESSLDELPVYDFRGPGCVPDGDYINEMTVEACSF